MLAVAASMLGGCAAKAQPTLADRFVRQGEAAADFGGRPPRLSRASTAARATDLRIAGVSRYYPAEADFDRHDPRVRTALAALAASPTLPHYLSAAQAYQQIGVLDKAYDHLQQAIAIDPHNAAANDSLARLWRDWKLPAYGLLHAHRAVYAAPRSATTRHTLGTVLYALGLRQEAEKSFREAAALEPHAWYAWQNLCTLAMAGGRTKDAIPLCQRADAERAASLKQARP